MCIRDRSFPGVKALDQVNLKVRPGTVHALMGENGAGKSTLMKCLFGIYHMDEGEIYLDGEKVSIANPDEALQKGLAMVHQELQPIPCLLYTSVSYPSSPNAGKFLDASRLISSMEPWIWP